MLRIFLLISLFCTWIFVQHPVETITAYQPACEFDYLDSITADNLDKLTQVNQIGKGALAGIKWMPNNRIAVKSTLNVSVYEPPFFENEPVVLPDSSFVGYIDTDESSQIYGLTSEGNILIWNTPTDEPILIYSENINPDDFVGNLKVFGNGKYLIFTFDQKTIKVLNIATQEVLANHTLVRGVLHLAIDIHPDSNQIVLGVGGSNVILWDFSINEITHEFDVQGSYANVAFNSDLENPLVAMSDVDNNIYVWSLKDFSLQETLKGHTYQVSKIIFTPDNQSLISSSFNGQMIIWDTDTFKSVNIFNNQSRRSILSPSYDDPYVVTVNTQNHIQIWDYSRNVKIAEYSEYVNLLWVLTMDSAGSALAYGGLYQYLYLWDICQNENMGMFQDMTSVNNIVISSSGELLATTDIDQMLIISDIQSGEIITTFGGNQDLISAITISGDDSLIASENHEGDILIWNINQSQLLAVRNESYVKDLVFAPHENLLAFNGERSLIIWNPVSGEQSEYNLRDYLDIIEFNASGTRVATSQEYNIQIINLENGNITDLRQSNEVITAMRFLDEENLFISGDTTGQIIIWDIMTGQILSRFQAHHGDIQEIYINSDRNFIVTLGQDSAIRFWGIVN